MPYQEVFYVLGAGGVLSTMYLTASIVREVCDGVKLGLHGRGALECLELGDDSTLYRWIASDIRCDGTGIAKAIMGKEKLSKLELLTEPSST